MSALQIAHAKNRWPDLKIAHGDALEYLDNGDETSDAAYSVFGAPWFGSSTPT